jgi:hypothetical protein
MADQFMGGILAGSTGVSIPVILRVKSDGAELTGKAAANMSAYYWRQGSTSIQVITMATLGSMGAAFSSGGWYEIDATNFKGMYRLDLPNTAVSTGAEWMTVGVKDTAASGFYYYERFALETKHINSLQDLSYADVKSAASQAWSAAAATIRVFPADGALTAAVFGADCITSAKVAAGAFVYDDQITTFKSELSGLIVGLPNGHITSAKIGADAFGSDKFAPGCLVYDDQITTFKSELSGLVISIPNGHITSAKIGADAIGSDKVAPGAFVYADQITVFDASIQSAASAAWASAAATNRVTPADGSITAAVLGADCITSAKVAAGALVYDDQITTFKSELSGMAISIPNGHITSAKIGADAFGSDKFAPGCFVYDDQITTFKSELSGMAITIPNGHITSAKIGADAIGSDKVAPGAFTYDDQITTFKSELSGVYSRLTTIGVRDIVQYTSAMAGAFPGSSPALLDAVYWNYANAGFKRVQTPTSYVVYDAAGSTKLASAPISGTSGVEVVIGAFT